MNTPTDELKHEAQNSQDPDRLRELANLLDYWNETDAAERARQKARKIEQQMSEVNA